MAHALASHRTLQHSAVARAACRPRYSALTCRAAVAGSTGVARKATEQPALEKFRQTYSTIRGVPELLPILRQAAQSKQVDPELVEGALVLLEQLAANMPASSRGELVLTLLPTYNLYIHTGTARVPGRWRLVYSSLGNFRPFQYIPIREDLVMDPSGSKSISLESELGPFQFDVRGTISSWDQASGDMVFQFDKGVAIKLGGKQVWEVQPTTKPKTYTFFYADDTICAARSSAGGLSLIAAL